MNITNKIKILVLNNAPLSEGGGDVRVLKEVFGRIQANENFSVYFLTPSPRSPEQEASDIHLHYVNTPNGYFQKRVFFYIRGIKKFFELVKKVNPDVVIDSPTPFPFYPAHFLKDTPLITIRHGVSGIKKQFHSLSLTSKWKIFSYKSGFLDTVGTFFAEETYRWYKSPFIAVSEYVKEELESKTKSKVYLVKNGIDQSRFNYVPEPSQKGDFVLCLTRLGKKKGVEFLVHAWDKLDYKNLDLIIAGDGPRKEYLEGLAQEVSSNIHFVGWVQGEKKSELYSKAMLYVLPTLQEGYGLTNLEAMASGTPVVSTKSVGVTEYMVDGQNGLLAEVANPESLAKKIDQAVKNPNLREELAKEAKRTAEEHSWEKAAEKYEKIIMNKVNAAK